MAEHVILFQIGIALIIVSLFGLFLCGLGFLVYYYFSKLLNFEHEMFDIPSSEDLWLKKNSKVLRIKNDTKTN